MAIQRLKELEEDMQKCFRCNLCKMIPLPVVKHADYFDGCPAVREYGFHSYSGSGKQIMGLSLLADRIPADAKLARVTFACTTCGSCDVACKFNMDAERMQVNMAMREHLVDEGQDLKINKTRKENLLKYGHAGGKQGTLAGAWADGLGMKDMSKDSARVLLFGGCRTRDDAGAAKTARKLARLFLLAGVDVGFLGAKEMCCGLPAYWTGYRDDFGKLAERNTRLFDETGAETLVVTSGSCLGAIRSLYQVYARSPKAKVLHATEFLWDLIREGKLSLPHPVRRSVTYHDPCYLGRRSEPPVEWEGESFRARGQMTYNKPSKPVNHGRRGVYEAPRKILEAIPELTLKEMHRNREYAFCCGGGGGVPEAYPEMGQSAAMHRIAEARDVGAESLVTACHECRGQFANAQAGSQGSAMPVEDIVDLVFEAAGLSCEETRAA